jgi:hypothetical protein
MPAASISLDKAVDLARTGDVWLFRGRKMADRAIQVATNSPVNHVGMSVVIDDLPPLMWHAELGRSLPDLWAGSRHRGVQLHDLRDAVVVWATRYGQRAWLRQLEPAVTGAMEDALLRTIARLDGTPFPSTTRLASRWLLGRAPAVRHKTADVDLETAYCARCWPSPTRPWGCCRAGTIRAGTTPAASGAVITSACATGTVSAVRSPSTFLLTWPYERAAAAGERAGPAARPPRPDLTV